MLKVNPDLPNVKVDPVKFQYMCTCMVIPCHMKKLRLLIVRTVQLTHEQVVFCLILFYVVVHLILVHAEYKVPLLNLMSIKLS